MYVAIVLHQNTTFPSNIIVIMLLHDICKLYYFFGYIQSIFFYYALLFIFNFKDSKTVAVFKVHPISEISFLSQVC